jgi:hypothetical protein
MKKIHEKIFSRKINKLYLKFEFKKLNEKDLCFQKKKKKKLYLKKNIYQEV